MGLLSSCVHIVFTPVPRPLLNHCLRMSSVLYLSLMHFVTPIPQPCACLGHSSHLPGEEHADLPFLGRKSVFCSLLCPQWHTVGT